MRKLSRRSANDKRRPLIIPAYDSSLGGVKSKLAEFPGRKNNKNVNSAEGSLQAEETQRLKI